MNKSSLDSTVNKQAASAKLTYHLQVKRLKAFVDSFQRICKQVGVVSSPKFPTTGLKKTPHNTR
jgi:hypothetical protein